MESKDCYFILDINELQENQKINVLCVDCRNKHFEDKGWFWDGSVRGYSPYLFKCSMCESIIHQPENKEDEE
jgi:hypothetical protein